MKRAFLVILASFVWLIGGGFAISPFVDSQDKSGLTPLLMWSLLFGWVTLFMIGSALWAKAKGYHPILGLILGGIGPLGLLILVFLRDKTAPNSSS